MATVVNKDVVGTLTDCQSNRVNAGNTAGATSSLVWKVTCLAWLIEKLVSWRIWTTYRMLPTVPVFTVLDRLPQAVQTLLYLASLLLLCALIFKSNKYLIVSLLTAEVCQCMLDQNRIQPWEYQYFFIALLIIAYSNNRRIFIASVAFLLTSTYFYSGVNKLNPGFLQSVWSNILLGQFLHLPHHLRHQAWLLNSGYLIPLMESILGVGLLFQKTQKSSAILLIAMHLVILTIFGPLGLRGYQILWFWNASMMAMLYLIFIRGGVDVFKDLAGAWKWLVVLFWGLLPALSFAGLWPKNLSSNMFSGNPPWMVICIQDFGHNSPLKRFSTLYDPLCRCKGAPVIYLQTWIFQETRVSINPERRLILQMQQRLIRQYPGCKFTFFVSPY